MKCLILFRLKGNASTDPKPLDIWGPTTDHLKDWYCESSFPPYCGIPVTPDVVNLYIDRTGFSYLAAPWFCSMVVF